MINRREPAVSYVARIATLIVFGLCRSSAFLGEGQHGKVIALFVPAFVITFAASGAGLQGPHELRVAELEARGMSLEKTFWVCDYIATTRGIHFTPIEHCSAVTEEVKINKFRGDHDEMVRWWRDNKHREHMKLEVQESR